MFTRTVIRQGKKIIKLNNEKERLKKRNKELEYKNYNANKECLSLIGALDDAQEEFFNILNTAYEILSSNGYRQPEVKIRRTLEYIREQKEIIKKDLEISNKKVLSTRDQTNR